MGLFDTMSGNVKCPQCNQITPCSIQFKWLHSSMTYYEIGDYIIGNTPLDIFDEDIAQCTHCGHMFPFYAIGNQGYLHGFCNNSDFPKLKSKIQLLNEDHFKTFTVVVNKNKLEHLDDFLLELKKEILSNPQRDTFYVSDFSVSELDSLLCRIPDGKTEIKAKFEFGELLYYDNSGGSYYPWSLRDVPFELTAIFFDERSQTFFYNISTLNGDLTSHFERVPEILLLTKTERLEKIQKYDDVVTQIVEWDKQDRERALANRDMTAEEKRQRLMRLSGAIQKSYLVDELKAQGLISPDFQL